MRRHFQVFGLKLQTNKTVVTVNTIFVPMARFTTAEEYERDSRVPCPTVTQVSLVRRGWSVRVVRESQPVWLKIREIKGKILVCEVSDSAAEGYEKGTIVRIHPRYVVDIDPPLTALLAEEAQQYLQDHDRIECPA